jgi:hypothetical protein
MSKLFLNVQSRSQISIFIKATSSIIASSYTHDWRCLEWGAEQPDRHLVCGSCRMAFHRGRRLSDCFPLSTDCTKRSKVRGALLIVQGGGRMGFCSCVGGAASISNPEQLLWVKMLPHAVKNPSSGAGDRAGHAEPAEAGGRCLSPPGKRHSGSGMTIYRSRCRKQLIYRSLKYIEPFFHAGRYMGFVPLATTGYQIRP